MCAARVAHARQVVRGLAHEVLRNRGAALGAASRRTAKPLIAAALTAATAATAALAALAANAAAARVVRGLARRERGG